MQPTLDMHHHQEPWIDFDAYRRRAARQRRLAKRRLVRRGLGLLAHAVKAGAADWVSPPALRAHCRPILLAGAAIALTISLAAVQSRAQGEQHRDHQHHIMVLPDDVKWSAGPPSLPPGAQVVMLEG